MEESWQAYGAVRKKTKAGTKGNTNVKKVTHKSKKEIPPVTPSDIARLAAKRDHYKHCHGYYYYYYYYYFAR